MKIPLAVYTATEGFDWQPGSSYTRVELNRYKEMIGKFPDILMEQIPYGGVFVCDGRLVFYRFHVFVRGDSRGRDALYCILGSVSLADGRRLDLGRVLNAREFASPMRPFPVELDAPEAAPRYVPQTRVEFNEKLAGLRSLSDVGLYASFFGKGKFMCRLSGNDENPAMDIAFENPDIPEPRPPAPSSPQRPRQDHDEDAIPQSRYETLLVQSHDLEWKLRKADDELRKAEETIRLLRGQLQIRKLIIAFVLAGIAVFCMIRFGMWLYEEASHDILRSVFRRSR